MSKEARKPIPSTVGEVIQYDPISGHLTWKVDRYSCKVGKIAGGLTPEGYRIIKVGSSQLMAHRIAWFLHYGEQPPTYIDHANGDRDDNRIENIRAVSNAQNQRNSRINANNKTGVKGVHFDKSAGRYKAKFKLNTKQICCGYHDTIEEAAEAIRSKREELHGEFAHHG